MLYFLYLRKEGRFFFVERREVIVVHVENFTDAECRWIDDDPQRESVILRMHEWIVALRAYRENSSLENDFACTQAEEAFRRAFAETGIARTSIDAADLHRLTLRRIREDAALENAYRILRENASPITPELSVRIKREHQKEDEKRP